MHLRRESLGTMGTNAIVAGGLPITCDHAVAAKARGGARRTVSFLGDGAIHQGTTHQAMHLAALYRLPLLFFCETNGYAVSTGVEQSAYETNLNTRPCAQGTVIRQELDAIDAAMSEAVDYAADSRTESKGSVMGIPDILWPDPATVVAHLVSEMSEFWHTHRWVPGSRRR